MLRHQHIPRHSDQSRDYRQRYLDIDPSIVVYSVFRTTVQAQVHFFKGKMKHFLINCGFTSKKKLFKDTFENYFSVYRNC